jgi:protein-tyrosine phosphatase
MKLDCTEIIPGRLWVGAYVRPEETASIAKMGITTVVSLQTDDDLDLYRLSSVKQVQACAAAGIDFRRVPTPDFDKDALWANLPACVGEVQSALADPRACVYLHCTAGINRAPTTAAAYLILTENMSPEDAYDFLVERRRCSPYVDLLEKYAQSLRAL